MTVELETNVEDRRPGEVALSVIGERRPGEVAPDGFAWVTAAEARAFAWRILVAARDAEEMAGAPR